MIALLQREEPSAVVAVGRLPRVNLLPPEISERERLRKARLCVPAAVLAAVGAVGLLHLAAAGDLREAEAAAQRATAEQARLNAEVATNREVTAVHTRAAAAQAMLVQAMGEEVRYSRFLDDLSTTVPEHVWITSLTFSQSASVAGLPASASGIGTVSVAGVAHSHEDLARWLETVAAQKGFGRPQLDKASKTVMGGEQVVTWSMTVPLTADALSGRYRKVGVR